MPQCTKIPRSLFRTNRSSALQKQFLCSKPSFTLQRAGRKTYTYAQFIAYPKATSKDDRRPLHPLANGSVRKILPNQLPLISLTTAATMTYRSYSNLSAIFLMATIFGSALSGCRSDEGARAGAPTSINGPRIRSDINEEGYLVERLDTDGTGVIDIIRYLELYEDPREPGRERRRLRRLDLDVNADGIINVIRHYDEFGNVSREENDVDLDGDFDSMLYFVGGELTRKELYAVDDGESVLIERRIYADGTLIRVERDQSEDGRVDLWEYYEDGVLMRIGRDTNGDGSANTWQFR